MPEPGLNLYRALLKVDSNQEAWVWVHANTLRGARRLLAVVYGNKIVDSSVKKVEERQLKPYQAEVRLSPTSVVLTEVFAEDVEDALEILSVLYGDRGNLVIRGHPR